MQALLTKRTANLTEAGSRLFIHGITLLIVIPVSTISSTMRTCLSFILFFKPIRVLVYPWLLS